MVGRKRSGENDMSPRMPVPVHPGEILQEEFMQPRGLSQYRVAKDIRVPARRINEIVLGKRAISPDTAIRLGWYFGTSAQFWINLQSHFDLEVALLISEKQIEQDITPLETVPLRSRTAAC
jgi:antitoxin HigA-1